MTGSVLPPLGVAVVGLGVGEQHARAFHADSRCRLHWLYDLNREKAQRLTSDLGAQGVAPSYDAILENREIQIVSIASYDECHGEQVRSALEAGKHVFVEKPLCQTVEQLQKIKEVWLAHGRKQQLGCNLVLRTAPLYRWLKEQLIGGRLGEVYAFDGEYLYGRLEKITEGWRSRTAEYSVMQGGGIHLIDLLVWLTGQKPATVFAVGNQICTAKSGFRYDDFVTATMQLPSAMVARISANFGCVHRHQHVVRVFGTEATFVFDDAGARLHLTRDSSVLASAITLPALPAGKGELIPGFVTAILENQDLGEDPQVLFDGISISLACDRSLRTSRCERVVYA